MQVSEINFRLLVRTALILLLAGGLMAVVHRWQMGRHARGEVEQADQAEAEDEPAEVVRSLARAVRFDPANRAVRARYAMALADQAQSPAERWKALQVLTTVVAQNPTDATARRRAAELALQLDEPDEAIKQLKPVLEDDPSDPDLLFLLGRAQEALGQLTDAADTLRKAAAAAPDRVAIAVRLAEVYRRLERTKQADALMDRLVQNNPSAAAARVAAARYHLAAGRLDRAARELEQARHLAPADVEVLETSAEVAERQGDTKQAVHWRRQLLQRHPEQADAYLQLAQAEQEAGQPNEAAATLQEGLKRLADHVDLLFALGWLRLEQGETAKAKALRDRLPARARGKALGLAGRAAAAEANWYQAARDYSAALEQADLTAAQRAQVLRGLAACYDQLGGRGEQLYALRQAVTLHPTPEAQLELAQALVHTGRGEAAVALLRPLAARLQARAAFHLLLARALLADHRRRLPAQREWKEVEAALNRADRDPAARPEVAELRADLFALQGDSAGARTVLDLAMALYPDAFALRLKAIDLALQQDDESTAHVFEQRGDERFGRQLDWFRGRADRLVRRNDPETASALLDLERRAKTLSAADRTRLKRYLAALFLRLGNAAEVNRLCQELLKQQPDDLDARMIRIEGLIAAGDDRPAKERIDELRRQEGPAGTLWRSGLVRWHLARATRGRRNDLDEARSLVQQLRELRPLWAYPLLLQGQLADLEGKDDEMLSCYREVARREGLPPRELRRVVALLTGRGQYAEAAALVDLAVASESADDDLVRLAAWLAAESGKAERAHDLAVAAVPLTSRSTGDLLWRAGILEQVGRTREVEDTLRAAAQLDPEAVEPRLTLITHLVRTNRLAEANMEVKRLAGAVDPPRLPMALGRAAEAIGHFDEAEKGYLAILQQTPRDADALRRLASLYLRLDQARKAEGVLAALLAPQVILPEERQREVRRQLALVLTAPEQPTDRTADALKLLEINRRQTGDRAVDRRVALLVRGRDAAARADSLHQLEALPGGPATTAEERLRLARLYDADGRWPAARTQLLALVRGDPRNPAYLALLIDGLLRHGKKAEAASWIDRLEQVDPQAEQLPAFKKRLKAPRS